MPVLAHGVGRVYESPIPLGYYLAGAAATVLVSFLIAALATSARPLGPGKKILGERPTRVLVMVLRGIALISLILMLVSGLMVRSLGLTFTTLAFWVGLIVLVTAVSALVGGLWEAIDPWATIERFYRLEDAEPRRLEIPWWVGPALLFGLFWFELVSGIGFEDFWVVVFLVVYSLLSFGFRAQIGDGWKLVDPLSILFGFASRSAPLRIDETGLYRRNMLHGLDEEEQMPKALFAAIFVLLAATTLDNLIETVGWSNLRRSLGLDEVSDLVVDSAAFLLLVVPFLVTFLAAIWIAHRWVGKALDRWGIARRFGWSLVPIGVAYVLAHNSPLLLTGVPQLVRFFSDPFDRGWNLLGTSEMFSGYSPSPQFVWFVEILLIVGGHILGVLAAHRIAVNLSDDHKDAVKSQYALTVLMSLYTIVTLWLLAQPLIA